MIIDFQRGIGNISCIGVVILETGLVIELWSFLVTVWSLLLFKIQGNDVLHAKIGEILDTGNLLNVPSDGHNHPRRQSDIWMFLSSFLFINLCLNFIIWFCILVCIQYLLQYVIIGRLFFFPQSSSTSKTNGITTADTRSTTFSDNSLVQHTTSTTIWIAIFYGIFTTICITGCIVFIVFRKKSKFIFFELKNAFM